MIAELTNFLAAQLEPLRYANVLTGVSGLVKTASVSKKDGKLSRFPVPYDQTDTPNVTGHLLIPESKHRAIVYFESIDSRVLSSSPKTSKIESIIRLVCWYNASMITYGSSGQNPVEPVRNVHSVMIATMLDRIHKTPWDSENLKAITIEVQKVRDNDPDLFSRYTYREDYSQYLAHPYYAFGIDLRVLYNFNHSCNAILIPSDGECC